MTKREQIAELFDILHELEEYDSFYSPEPSYVYNKYDKGTLHNFILKMKRKQATARHAKEFGSKIIHRMLRLPDTIDLFIYEWQLCRNVGIGHVVERDAQAKDFKKYPVVI